MRLGDFTFKPTLVPSLITLLVLSILLALGFWQLDRARQKEDLQAAFEFHLSQPYTPVEAIDLLADHLFNNASRYRKVTAHGRYDSEHQILLDNKVHKGQPGYHIFTPLLLSEQTPAILVNRGWVPLGESREHLPVLDVDTAPVDIKGWIAQPANPGLYLRNPRPDNDWPLLVSYIDYADLAQQLGYALAPAIILLDPQADNGYLRDWQPRFAGFGPERHRGYAVQWFALALTLIIIYVFMNTRRDGRGTDTRV